MADKVDAPTSSDALGKDNGSGPKAIVKNVDMSEEMQQEAVDVASVALEKYNIEKDIAAQIKEFDRCHGAAWHVVVGKNFGSYATYSELFVLAGARATRARVADAVYPPQKEKPFIYFYINQLAILIWKSSFRADPFPSCESFARSMVLGSH